ncbi:hypothetical protein DY000_02038505 [Brassica cretica]|uniref:Uncharacterized protein n=1 Tax=Brassica cretica TaxID=69181 RepID=A0ABQ7B8G8_BRACR|nr:hypothetical protein DY000_02038505 [Brassica cretica]
MLIQRTVNANRLHTLRDHLSEGSVYISSGFDFTRSNNDFRLSDAHVSIRFNDVNDVKFTPEELAELITAMNIFFELLAKGETVQGMIKAKDLGYECYWETRRNQSGVLNCCLVKHVARNKAYIADSANYLTKPFVSMYFGVAYFLWLSDYDRRFAVLNSGLGFEMGILLKGLGEEEQ